MFHKQHASNQDACIADEQATRLKDQPAIEIARRPFDNFGIGLGVRWRFVVVAIRNSQAAAKIDMRDLVAVATQDPNKFGEQRESISERVEFGDLTADVHIDAGDFESLQLGGPRVNLARAADRNAELVLRLSGRDLVVCLGVDVGIDADRNPRSASLRRRNRRQQFEFSFRFDIDAKNSFIDGRCKFGSGFADAGEHDLLRRNAGKARALEFAARYDVSAGTKLRECCKDRLIGVGLHRIADKRAHVGKRIRKNLIVTREGRGRVTVKRRTDLGSERIEVHRLGVQHAVAIGKVVHGTLS
jgi:hypothetical protein